MMREVSSFDNAGIRFAGRSEACCIGDVSFPFAVLDVIVESTVYIKVSFRKRSIRVTSKRT